MAARDHARPALQAPGELDHHAIRHLVPFVKRCRTNPEAITLGALCAAQLIIDFDVACLIMLICVFSQLFIYSHLVQPHDFLNGRAAIRTTAHPYVCDYSQYPKP
jgi:hypothetical protein